jgi:hypothetical protein
MYITDEQFLEQTKKVQNNLIKWWKPSMGDIFIDLAPNSKKKPVIIEDEGDCIDTELVKYEVIPLFSEGQIRRYIEDKLSGKVQSIWSDNSYCISVDIKGQQWWRKTNETELLQAYWKVVIELASN